MSGDANAPVPTWLVWLAGILGPTAVWLYSVARPFMERTQAKREAAEALKIKKEQDELARLQKAADKAFEIRDAILQGHLIELRAQLADARSETAQVRALHELCRSDTASQAVLIATLKERTDLHEQRQRANDERIEGLSNENARLRQLVVQQETQRG